jgi:hypothetical protein
MKITDNTIIKACKFCLNFQPDDTINEIDYNEDNEVYFVKLNYHWIGLQEKFVRSAIKHLNKGKPSKWIQ